MARVPTGVEKTRLNLEIPLSVREKLEEIRLLSEADSYTEVFRRSLAVYYALLVAMRRDAKIVIRERDGSESTFLPIIP
jgi:hypothetical protein